MLFVWGIALRLHSPIASPPGKGNHARDTLRYRFARPHSSDASLRRIRASARPVGLGQAAQPSRKGVWLADAGGTFAARRGLGVVRGKAVDLPGTPPCTDWRLE
jgi:hypothetical protein